MNWLKESWFKGGLLLLGFSLVIIFSYNQFLETKKHNLDIVNQQRLCASTFAGDSKSTQDCSNATQEQKI